jgi:hypothetical protein
MIAGKAETTRLLAAGTDVFFFQYLPGIAHTGKPFYHSI